jgi:cation transport protein ChaC
MIKRKRRMSLTPKLVARCERPEPDPGPNPGFTPIKPEELDNLTTQLVKELADRDLWLFAYGSLIWKLNFSFVEHRRGTVHGWHRAFCMEQKRWRGSPQQPGLMMALEKGGCCTGVVFRLPDGEHREHIRQLVDREISMQEDLGMVRWATVRADSGPVRALVFWAGPKGDGIFLRLPLERVAWVLARACGHVGSCASYLHNTVLKLEEFGIHDRNLWRLQELVAEEIHKFGSEGPA